MLVTLDCWFIYSGKSKSATYLTINENAIGGNWVAGTDA